MPQWASDFAMLAIFVGCVSLLAWQLAVMLYRRFLHPIAHVPGPMFASMTELHRFYYNSFKVGKYYLEYDRYREKYGAVIRIAPNEVLIADAINFDQIHRVGSQFYRDPGFYSLLGSDKMSFSTISNEDHKRHRSILNPFFSRRAIMRQEHIVQRMVDELCRLVETNAQHARTTNMMLATRALAVDVVTEYVFGPEGSWNFLKDQDLGQWWPELLGRMFPMVFVLRLLPWLKAPLESLPLWVTDIIAPDANAMYKCQERCKTIARKVKQQIENGTNHERETIFHPLLKPESIKSSEQVTVQYLGEESLNVVAAGGETTGSTLELIIFHVLYNRAILERLREELVDAFPDSAQPTPFIELEKLPYLTAVIKEGLRLGMGVITPLPRVVPVGGAIFNELFLPQGTVVSTTPWFNHRDPRAFPEPDNFDPGRWLKQGEARRLERFMVPFSRGQRACMGQTLAYVELYVCLGRLFRRFDDLKLHDTRPEDMVWEDRFLPFHVKGARGLRISRAADI